MHITMQQFACAAHLHTEFGDAVDNVTLKPESVVVLGSGKAMWVVGVPENDDSFTSHRKRGQNQDKQN